LFHRGHFHEFGHHAGHGAAHSAFALEAIIRILILFVALVLGVIARYAVSQWALREYGDERKANALGWLALLAVILVLGTVALKIF
jgi:ACR3 family arsenite efflux pump ArsB